MPLRPYALRLRRLVDSKPLTATLAALVAVLACIVIFEAGVLLGMHEERSSYRWGEDYARNFGGPAGGFIPGAGAMADGHGAFGRIASVSGSAFVITDPNHPEERVRVASDTVIRNGSRTVTQDALTAGTYVVVIGLPGTDGTIDAKLVRIMPAPPDSSEGMASSSVPAQAASLPQR